MPIDPERPLEGQAVLVTGGTRGIGGATALVLAGEGAMVIATYRDPKKEGRVQELVNQAAGLPGNIVPFLADITKPSQRERLRRWIYGGGYHLAVLVSNAAGGIDKQNPRVVNSDGKIALVRELAPLFSDRALVLEVESSWSRFYPYVEQLPMYDPVASSKKRGRDRLIHEVPLVAKANYKEIGLGFIIGHAVDGTITYKLLKKEMLRKAGGKEKWDQLVATAEGGKLPIIDDMAKAVLETIYKFQAGQLEFGGEKYVGVPNWDQEEVKRRFYMYGPASLYVDQTVFHTPKQSFTLAHVGKRHMEPLYTAETGPIIQAEQGVSSIHLARFTSTKAHAYEHFTPETGLQIVPGFKLVAAAQIGYAGYLQNLFSVFGQEHFRWDGVMGETKFEKPVPPRAIVDILLGDEFPLNGGGWSGNIELMMGGATAVTVNGVLMRPGIDRNRHLKPRLIEVAAQAAGAQFMHLKELEGVNSGDLVPLFRGIGLIEFLGVVREGDAIQTEVKSREVRRNGFVSDAVLRVGDRVIARIDGINCGVLTGGPKAIERIKRSIQGGVN
ncbi:SDR family NAD(P)-dependent oxidoreductase [Candidatus Daviesbacteria bacterium]|nr:SDR family NAD(P)-dependent oxidoreductase [Candidatus Daviesbacteria bacterium]